MPLIPPIGTVPDVVDGVDEVMADWGNSVGGSAHGRVVHRFNTAAELGTAIPAPTQGMLAVTVDTDTLWQAVGVNPVWTPALAGKCVGTLVLQGGPWGSNSLAGIGTLTWTAHKGRRYVVSGEGMARMDTAADIGNISFWNGPTQAWNWALSIAAGGYGPIPALGYHDATADGPMSLDVKINVSFATGSLTIQSGLAIVTDAGYIAAGGAVVDARSSWPGLEDPTPKAST